MPDLLERLTEERHQVADALTAMVDADDFDPDGKEFKDLKTRGEQLDKRVTAVRDAAQHRAAADALRGIVTRPPAGTVAAGPDVGEQILRSDSYREWRRHGSRGRWTLGEIHTRAVLTSTWFPGQDSRIVADPPVQRTPLLDVLNKVQVSSGSVEIVTYLPQPPAAGVVAEGAPKPEATITTSVTTATLETLAHWIEVTRQALEDESMVRDLISNGLLRGVTLKAEQLAANVINGGAWQTVSGADMLQGIRLAVAELQNDGFSPNAILINPSDAADLDFTMWGMPGSSGPTIGTNLFGCTLVPAAGITAGSPLVGDWPTAVKWLYTSAAQLYVSDSDVSTTGASNFKANIITFLAEQRCKAVIVQTGAALKVAVTP